MSTSNKELLGAEDLVSAGVKPSCDAVRTAYARIARGEADPKSMPPKVSVPSRRALAVRRVDLERWLEELGGKPRGRPRGTTKAALSTKNPRMALK